MTKSLCRDGAWKRAATLLSSALLATLAAGFAGHARATGYFGPFEFLSDGSRLAETPEFYWDTEVKRLARNFHPKEKPALVPRTLSGEDGTVDTAPMQRPPRMPTRPISRTPSRLAPSSRLIRRWRRRSTQTRGMPCR